MQAAKDFNIDLSESYMIDDSENDIKAGKNAGCRESILVSDKFTLENFVEKYLRQ